MKNVYERVNNNLNESKRDVSFSPNLLNELDDEERMTVEEKIVYLCLNGDSTSFQFIPHLKTINIEENFTEEKINKLNPYKKALIYKELYNRYKNNIYIKNIINLSSEDIKVYSLLTIMFINNELPIEYRDELKNIADNSSNEMYRNMFDKRIGRLDLNYKSVRIH